MIYKYHIHHHIHLVCNQYETAADNNNIGFQDIITRDAPDIGEDMCSVESNDPLKEKLGQQFLTLCLHSSLLEMS